MNKQIETRYKSLIQRSFVSRLDLFLFSELYLGGSITTIDCNDFISFTIDDAIVEMYEKAWQYNAEDMVGCMKASDYDTQIAEWYSKQKELKANLYSVYSSYFKQNLSFIDFSNKCLEAKCAYCEITEEQIASLKASGLIKTKRGRGSRMEIDRLNSNKEYTLENIVLACYWCNNSKTDEFTYTEFKEMIAPGIKATWGHRFKSIL